MPSTDEVQQNPRDTYQLLFSPDGKVLIDTGGDWKTEPVKNGQLSSHTPEISTVFWDSATGSKLAEVKYGRYCYQAALSPDGKLLAITDGWDKARLFKVPSGELLRELDGVCRDFLSFTPDGKKLITAVYEGSSHFVVRIGRGDRPRQTDADVYELCYTGKCEGVFILGQSG